jgi:hypothetical protein
LREKQWSKLTNEDQTAFIGRRAGTSAASLDATLWLPLDPKIVASGKIAKSTPE